jgi:two-component system LytT family response regulator
MAKVTCVVVDDESLARRQLLCLLKCEPLVEVLGEADRKQPAIDSIDALRPDLVFLDIRMPGGGGFEIAEQIHHKPKIVFVTAYDQYAVRAFEVNAMDYLLKPVSSERLHASISRLFPASPSHAIGHGDSDPKSLERKLLPIGNTGHFVPVSDLLYIQSDDHYTRVVVDGGKEYQVRQPLREWLSHLPDSVFVKIERGLVLNASKIISASVSSAGGSVTLGRSREILQLGNRAAQRLRVHLARTSKG